MKYYNRAIEKSVTLSVSQFPVVAITGPRQSGKSTMLQKLYPQYQYYTFDDPILRQNAKDDPGFFIENLQPPVILDEIQYLPELMPFIKIRVDRNRQFYGQFILTGSQVFNLMKNLSESLAGRIAILELLPFNIGEIQIDLPTNMTELFNVFYKGFYPDPCVHKTDPKIYYASYFQTYLERDIRQLTSVHDLSLFQRFVELLAARCGSILNISDVAKDCGISHTTGQKWLSLLESSRIIYLLRPYFSSMGKRIIKSPKIYFTDTGLLAYTLKYPSSETLHYGPMAGHIFENFLVIETLKQKFNTTKMFEMFYFRDSNKNEIDLLIETALKLYVFEIKMRQNISRKDYSFLEKFSVSGKVMIRYLVSSYNETIQLSQKVTNIPWQKFIENLQIEE